MSPRTKTLPYSVFTIASAALLLALACNKPSGKSGHELTANETRGKKLFIANCQKCHQPDTGMATQGPPLDGMFDKQFLPSGTPANDERVTNVIQFGRRTMPAFGPVLDESQVRDVVEYLHTQ